MKRTIIRIVIISILTLIMIGLGLTLILITINKDKEIKELQERIQEKISINLNITKELDDKTKEINNCLDNSKICMNAGLIMTNWKQRTEKIMVEIDLLFADYVDNSDNYCYIYDSERSAYEKENKRIFNKYVKIVEEVKELINEQK
jgi:hypothetical protein